MFPVTSDLRHKDQLSGLLYLFRRKGLKNQKQFVKFLPHEVISEGSQLNYFTCNTLVVAYFNTRQFRKNCQPMKYTVVITKSLVRLYSKSKSNETISGFRG